MSDSSVLVRRGEFHVSFNNNYRKISVILIFIVAHYFWSRSDPGF